MGIYNYRLLCKYPLEAGTTIIASIILRGFFSLVIRVSIFEVRN